MMRCHTEKGVFIPGCMGGAIHGKRGCTCPSSAKPPKLFVAYGHGFSGDYDTHAEAARVVGRNGHGAVYVRADSKKEL